MNVTPIAYNDIPLDLPHAGRVALRLCRVIENRAQDTIPSDYAEIGEIADELNRLLYGCRLENEAPFVLEESEQLRQQAASLGRQMTAEIEKRHLGDDRIGQCIRNLFECLAMGEEGANLSLLAGEIPLSLQRPL